jgi:hypothetical protein
VPGDGVAAVGRGRVRGVRVRSCGLRRS